MRLLLAGASDQASNPCPLGRWGRVVQWLINRFTGKVSVRFRQRPHPPQSAQEQKGADTMEWVDD